MCNNVDKCKRILLSDWRVTQGSLRCVTPLIWILQHATLIYAEKWLVVSSREVAAETGRRELGSDNNVFYLDRDSDESASRHWTFPE